MPTLSDAGWKVHHELTARISRSLVAIMSWGVTNDDLANAVGVNKGTMSCWVRGHSALNLVSAERIVRAAHVSRDWFYAGIGPMFEGGRTEPDPYWMLYRGKPTPEVGARVPAPKARRRR